MEHFYKKTIKGPDTYELVIGVPRFISVSKNRALKIINQLVDFTSIVFCDAGTWKMTIKQHGEGFYLEKVRVND